MNKIIGARLVVLNANKGEQMFSSSDKNKTV